MIATCSPRFSSKERSVNKGVPSKDLESPSTVNTSLPWALLLEIPYGETTTYGTLARKLAEKQGLTHMSAQAVGGAVGHNDISLIIPCHRVVGASGSLTGYAGGVDKKIKLLELERADMKSFFVPKKGTAL